MRRVRLLRPGIRQGKSLAGRAGAKILTQQARESLEFALMSLDSRAGGHSTPASATSNNRIFLIPLYSGSISQFSARLWAPSQGPAPVEIEEMPARSAALELFDPAFPIGGSKPITRCTASEMRTRYDSRWPGIVAAGEAEIISVFTFMPARAASSFRMI